jgi:hypothetical protein
MPTQSPHEGTPAKPATCWALTRAHQLPATLFSRQYLTLTILCASKHKIFDNCSKRDHQLIRCLNSRRVKLEACKMHKKHGRAKRNSHDIFVIAQNIFLLYRPKSYFCYTRPKLFFLEFCFLGSPILLSGLPYWQECSYKGFCIVQSETTLFRNATSVTMSNKENHDNHIS